MSVFNLATKKSHIDRTCFFDDPVDIARYDKVRYPAFEKLTEKQLSFFWRPEEVELSRDGKDFKGLTEHEKHIFKQQMSAGQQGHNRKFDDSGFAFNDAGNILLNRRHELSGFHRVVWPFLLR